MPIIYKILFNREHVGIYLDTSDWELLPSINLYFSPNHLFGKKIEGVMISLQWLCFCIAIAYESKGGK